MYNSPYRSLKAVIGVAFGNNLRNDRGCINQIAAYLLQFVRDLTATIIGVVGAGGIGLQLSEQISHLRFRSSHLHHSPDSGRRLLPGEQAGFEIGAARTHGGTDRSQTVPAASPLQT
jgi:hypothetical protein